ncbi:type II toxin-antitoxin system RelE/ParE family toxin [Tahibacter soli]|jgi:addiction module RelE/StbE family toxin|uniref:Type II toxin-antitoxin system RelE/ParE family toxin n=1 Tax=Tahibacter soli TaxID=2983605 RepID=A0A9X4BLU3_9GAMM|nr:type II toxin-antitoxin system RelE/ParE family toxin [Tahibacter soli]MDC8015717.1 type II toxin-antitoxin system RelE/ParE family toxin [Tahibacter soli]
MLKLEWTAKAAVQFKKNQRYYNHIDRQVARLLAMRVNSALLRLRVLPDSGRKGIYSGTRECVVQRSPYIIVYRVVDDTLQVVRVWHGRQDWTNVVE